MSSPPPSIELSIEGDDVVIVGEATLKNRTAALFFRSVVGASATETGWRCPRRDRTVASLVVRINTFLERHGFGVTRVGLADKEVERELERRRSFSRMKDAAARWKAGEAVIDSGQISRQLSDFGWSTERVLRPHQQSGLAHALVAGNAANFSVPGSGKTATALAVAATHLAAGTIDMVLVIGPLACFAPWEYESAISLGNRLPTRRLRGTAAQRRVVYSQALSPTLLLLSFATAASDRPALTEFCKTHDVMLIVDESHRIKRFRGGLWASALLQIAQHARVRMILSGTPMPQSGKDLFSQLSVLWPGGELTGTPDSFAIRVDSNFDAIQRDVNPFMSRTPKSALGLLPYEVHFHEVPLGGTQAEIYELILGRFRQRLADAATWTDKLEALRRGRPIRLLQAAANPDLLNRNDGYYRLPRLEGATPTLMDRLATYGTHEAPAKSTAALRLLKEILDAGGKAVCWSNFVGNLDQFAKMVKSHLNVPCFQIDGRVPTGDDASDDGLNERSNPEDLDTRERIIARFLRNAGPAVLVTNPASCSESISLHRGCHNAIYLDRTYDAAQFLQSIDRVHRLGLPSDVVVQIHILLATLDNQPTIDHLVHASLRGKDAAMRRLLEGAELAPIAQSDDPLDDAQGDEHDLVALLRYLLGEESATADAI